MSTRTKRTVKFLATCTDTEIIRSILKYTSSNSLLKSICNAALNCASGEITISESEKITFKKHRKAFEYLTNKQSLTNIKKYFLANKLNVLRLIPLILDSVLRSIGTSFIVEEPEKKPRSKNVRVPKVHIDQSERAGSSEGEENQGVQPNCTGSSSGGEEH